MADMGVESASEAHRRACLLEEQGELDAAEDVHRSVIHSGDPVYGQLSALSMGLLLVDAREWGAAHRVLMIAADGADIEVAAQADTAMSIALTELGDMSGAREALARARRLLQGGADAGQLRSMVALARLELGEGDVDQAEELLSFVVEHDPGSKEARELLARVRT